MSDLFFLTSLSYRPEAYPVSNGCLQYLRLAFRFFLHQFVDLYFASQTLMLNEDD